jgi:hypothetical protein
MDSNFDFDSSVCGGGTVAFRRNRFTEDIIKARKCLKEAWWKKDLIKQQED